MNTKQMILVEHLINEFFRYKKDNQYKLIFTVDGHITTGSFLRKDEKGISYAECNEYYYLEKTTDIFQSQQEDKRRSLREKLLNELNYNILGLDFLTTRPDLILASASKVVSQINPDEYLKEDLKFLPYIYNFKDIGSGKTFDYYLIHDEVIKPVSLVIENEWIY